MKISTLSALILSVALILNAFPKAYAQEKSPKPPELFEKVEAILVNGNKIERLPARLRLEEASLVIEVKRSGEVLKKFDYTEHQIGRLLLLQASALESRRRNYCRRCRADLQFDLFNSSFSNHLGGSGGLCAGQI